MLALSVTIPHQYKYSAFFYLYPLPPIMLIMMYIRSHSHCVSPSNNLYSFASILHFITCSTPKFMGPI